jgi:hypothetical protein
MNLSDSDVEINRIKVKLEKKVKVYEKYYGIVYIPSLIKMHGRISDREGNWYNFINGIVRNIPDERIMLIIENDEQGNIKYIPKEYHPAFKKIMEKAPSISRREKNRLKQLRLEEKVKGL